jgi:H+/gluconate symporter-like permease
VRFARASFVAATPLLAYAAAAAALNGRQVELLPTRGAIRPDPLTSAIEVLGLALAIATYAMLGRHVALHSGSEADAIRAGVLGGTLAGALGGVLSALAVREYIAARLRDYAVPREELLLATQIAYALALAAGGAMVGAVAAWGGWRRWRPRPS